MVVEKPRSAAGPEDPEPRKRGRRHLAKADAEGGVGAVPDEGAGSSDDPARPRFRLDQLATQVGNPSSAGAADLRVLPIAVEAALDPRLQLAIANHRTGKRGLTLSSTTADEVAVVARVTSVEDWQ